MSYYLSVDNLVGVQPTTTSSTILQAKQIDIYNGTTNFHRLTSSALTPLVIVSFPDASGVVVLDTATQTITNKLFRAQNGTSALPSYSFQSQNNLGMFRSATNTIGWTTNSIEQLTLSTTDLVSVLPIKTNEFRLRSSFGSAGNTIYGATDGTQGMYFGLNQISLSTNSTERLRVIDTRTIAYTPITTADASAATPSIHFNSSTSTGLYYTAGPTLNVSVNGTQRAAFESGGLKLYGSTAGNNALYVPSGLQYYEEATVSMQFQFPTGQTTAAGNVKFVRIGGQVIMQIPSYASIKNLTGVARPYQSTTAIPLRFQPSSLVMSPLIGIVNGGNSNTLSCYINSGIIYIEKLTSQFANNDYFQTYSFSMSWVL